VSYVTTVVVHVDYRPEEPEWMLRETFPFEQRYMTGLEAIDTKGAGGSKGFEGEIFAGSFNYLDVDDLVAWFKGLPWGESGSAVLSASTNGNEHRIVTIRNGRVGMDEVEDE
jgi:hypothetical protein